MSDPKHPTIYDINLDDYRPVTQADIDKMEELIQKLMHEEMGRQSVENVPPPEGGFNFRLACFRNKMRSDGLFVAEDIPIQPYADILDPKGGFIYPSTPRTPWHLRGQLPHAFAQELVRRWNLYADAQEAQGQNKE
jgi:hypothetical protein